MSSGFTPWDALSGGIGGAFQYAGAKKQADAAEQAAKTSADASNHAADLANTQNLRAEQFQREQADAFARETEIDRRANYDLSAKKRQGLGSIADLLGFHVNTDLPAYVPGVVPDFLSNSPASVGDAVGGTYNFAAPGQPMNLQTPFPADQLAQIKARVAAQGGGYTAGRPPSVGSLFGA
jgi:hypothetical protein